MKKHSIGIIANPQSGRDIRRLVAHASVFDNEEKVNIVERLLATWNTMGLSSVLCQIPTTLFTEQQNVLET